LVKRDDKLLQSSGSMTKRLSDSINSGRASRPDRKELGLSPG